MVQGYEERKCQFWNGLYRPGQAHQFIAVTGEVHKSGEIAEVLLRVLQQPQGRQRDVLLQLLPTFLDLQILLNKYRLQVRVLPAASGAYAATLHSCSTL